MIAILTTFVHLESQPYLHHLYNNLSLLSAIPIRPSTALLPIPNLSSIVRISILTFCLGNPVLWLNQIEPGFKWFGRGPSLFL